MKHTCQPLRVPEPAVAAEPCPRTPAPSWDCSFHKASRWLVCDWVADVLLKAGRFTDGDGLRPNHADPRSEEEVW